MPASVEMPAPVRTTTARLRLMSARASAIVSAAGVSKSGVSGSLTPQIRARRRVGFGAVGQPLVLYDVAERIATITLNRPERLNAWTGRMSLEYRQALAGAAADPEV